MARPFPEVYFDRVVPRQQLLNKALHYVPFQSKRLPFEYLLFIEAIVHELHIYFGQYYQFQTRSVQCEICSETRTRRLLRVRVVTVIPSQYA